MAHKKLLTEAEIRRFMKLASMGRVGDTKIQELGYGMDAGARDEEVPVDDEMGELPPEPVGGEEEIDAEMELEEPMGDEMGGEEPAQLSPEQAEAIEDAVAAVVDTLADKLGPLGVQISSEQDGEEEIGEPEMDLGMDMDLGMEDPAPEGAEAEEGGEPELPAEEEEFGMMNEESIVNEVTRRVAARLTKENHREKMAEQLTERIFARLTNK